MKKDKEIDGLAKDSNQPSPIRDYFPFQFSFKDAIQDLEDTDKLVIYEAITDFAFFGIEPALTSPFAKLCWKLIRPVLEKSHKNFISSKQGGAPKGNQNATKTTEKQPKNNRKTTEKQPQLILQNNHQESIYNNNYNYNDNENNNDNIKENISKRKVITFHAPVLDEVVAYCIEKHYNIDVEQFIDYYTANGWMVGKNKMKDWRAAVRNWVRRNKEISNSNNRQHGNERDEYTAMLEESIINDIKSIK